MKYKKPMQPCIGFLLVGNKKIKAPGKVVSLKKAKPAEGFVGSVTSMPRFTRNEKKP